jgi:hypothetical protein
MTDEKIDATNWWGGRKMLFPLMSSLAFGVGTGFTVPVVAELDSVEEGADVAAWERHETRVAGSVDVNNPHGEEQKLLVTSVFDSLDSSGGRAVSSFHLEADNLLKQPIRIVYAWQLEDDLGITLAAGESKKAKKVDGNGLFVGESWQLPSLKEGFYRMDITSQTRGVKDEDGMAKVSDWWLEVVNGELHEISEADWYQRSMGSLAQEAASDPTEEGDVVDEEPESLVPKMEEQK